MKELVIRHKTKAYATFKWSEIVQINTDKFGKARRFKRNPKYEQTLTFITRDKDETLYLEMGSESERDRWLAMYSCLQRYRLEKNLD